MPSASQHPLYYVAIYGAIGFGGVIITTVYTIVQYGGAVRASRLLFTRLLSSLVHATMRWHDVTPTGQPHDIRDGMITDRYQDVYLIG